MPLRHESMLAAVAALLAAGSHLCEAQSASPRRAGRAPTHPSGVLTARVVNVVGRPFAVRVSARNVVYVTEQDANAVAQFNLNDLMPGAAIAVGKDPGDVVFNRAGTTALVSGFHDGTVRILDVTHGRSTRLVPISRNAYRLALSRDETGAFVTSTNGRLYAIDLNGDSVTRSVHLGGVLNGLAFLPASNTLIVSSTTGTIWKVDAATLQVIGSPATDGGRLQDVAIAPDESEIYASSEDGWVVVLDAATLEQKQRVTLPRLSPFGLAVTPDGAQLYVTSPQTGDLAVIDRATLRVVKTIKLGGMPRRVAFDKRGRIAVIANEENWVDLVR